MLMVCIDIASLIIVSWHRHFGVKLVPSLGTKKSEQPLFNTMASRKIRVLLTVRSNEPRDIHVCAVVWRLVFLQWEWWWASWPRFTIYLWTLQTSGKNFWCVFRSSSMDILWHTNYLGWEVKVIVPSSQKSWIGVFCKRLSQQNVVNWPTYNLIHLRQGISHQRNRERKILLSSWTRYVTCTVVCMRVVYISVRWHRWDICGIPTHSTRERGICWMDSSWWREWNTSISSNT